jgi:SSS family transporter
MKPFLLPLTFLACLSALLPGSADGASAVEDPAGFTLQFDAATAYPASTRAGAFGVLVDGRWISGGGVESPVSLNRLEQATPTRDAVVFEPADDAWTTQLVQLPEPVAWPAVAADSGSVIIVGGLRDAGISDRVSRWTWNGTGWTVEELPRLPAPIVLASASILDGTLTVAGGTGPAGTNQDLLELDLSDPGGDWRTAPFEDIPSPLLQPLMVVRKDEVAIRNALYIGGGWTVATADGSDWRPVTRFYKYLPSATSPAQPVPVADSPAGLYLYSATGLGPAHILAASIAREDLRQPPALVPLARFPTAHFLRYHVFTDTWTSFTSGIGKAVTALSWTTGKELVIGTADPDDRETLHKATIVATERHFSVWDYIVMAAYMIGLVAIGNYFASRERGTEDFFLGGRRVPWWAAGLSIYATGTSAISFMAIPAKTYSTDWLYFIGMSIFPFFTVLIAAYVFIPLLRRLELTTVMEYFELRFGRPIRLLMSAIAVLGQVAGRMSITLLLPSIALTAVTGMNLYFCILVMGVLATIYTAVGGINAVIWTDVLQVFVLFGGALLSFALIVMKVDGGITSMVSLAVEDNKLNLLDTSWNFTTATIWIMVLWAVSDVFGKGLGQEGLQRAFSTKGVREARRSMITCAVVALPAGFLFYGIGTALYAFYHAHPELLNPTLQTDAIFPLFIAQQLPVGIAGLVISGLFAASMSTLDTAMNTSATILVRDFYSIWRKDKGDHEQLILAKVITLICGILGTGIALYMASFENLGSLWDMFSILLGVIGGGLGGVGVLALCTTRANTWGTLAGAVVTAVCIVLIKQYTPVHFFIYGTISMAIGGTTGYLFSLVLPGDDKDLTGLTLWTPAPKATRPE